MLNNFKYNLLTHIKMMGVNSVSDLVGGVDTNNRMLVMTYHPSLKSWKFNDRVEKPSAWNLINVSCKDGIDIDLLNDQVKEYSDSKQLTLILVNKYHLMVLYDPPKREPTKTKDNSKGGVFVNDTHFLKTTNKRKRW